MIPLRMPRNPTPAPAVWMSESEHGRVWVTEEMADSSRPDRGMESCVHSLFSSGFRVPDAVQPLDTLRLRFCVMSELRRDFHEQLQVIDGNVVELFAFVGEDLTVATEALLNSDAGALKVVAEREAIIEGIYGDVELLINQQMVLQAPVASDLRLLLSVLRILPDQERAHRLTFHIAEHATHVLSDDLSPRTRGLVQRMGETAADMWNQAARAWYGRDRTAADALEERDDDMDSLHAAMVAELASGTTKLPVAMDMTLVARHYERFADHAVNIAHRVVYLAGPEGKDQPG
jgi:phosphate transport system protein